MRIMICGSMTFAKEMIDAKEKLQELGHIALVPPDIDQHIDNPFLIDDFQSNYKHALETNVMKEGFRLIAKSDAILALNHVKNGVKGYVGTSTLMEIGIAYYFGKKIFLLNKIPKAKEVRWAHELKIIQPIILNGDLTKIR